MPFPNPATQFPSGQSGNPKGRPKKPISSALEELMTPELAKVMAHTLAAMAVGDKKALKGRTPEIAWMREVLERVEGKVKDELEVTDVARKEYDVTNTPDLL